MAIPPPGTPAPVFPGTGQTPLSDTAGTTQQLPTSPGSTALHQRLGSTDQAGVPARQSLMPSGATLPGPLLRAILRHVPLSSHGSCALVCRHWHTHLPDTRTTVARWLESCSQQQRQRSRYLVEGYSSRIRPWLASLASPHLPLLESQYQQWRHLCDALKRNRCALSRQEEEQARQQHQAAQRFFSGLLQYCLHRQLVETHELELRPAPLPDTGNRGPITTAAFSPCSRWLALAQRVHDTCDSPALLRLYGWQHGSWQRESLESSQGYPSLAEQPLECLAFSDSAPDKLFTGQRGGLVIGWSRAPDAALWYPAPVIKTDQDACVCRLVPAPHADLFILLRRPAPCPWRVLILHERRDRPGWEQCASQDYGTLYSIQVAPRQNQVALATQDADANTVVHIWQRDLNSAQPGGWGFAASTLDKSAPLLHLHYSPDGRCLLGFMAGQRASLWELDASHRLSPQLYCRCVFSEDRHHLQAQRPFHQHTSQLALASGSGEVLFWCRQDSARWSIKDRLSVTTDATGDLDVNTACLAWTANGQILIRVSLDYVELWSKQGTDRWQMRMRYLTEEPGDQPPGAWLLAPDDRRCATILPHQACLWIHGEDTRGSLIKQASASLQKPFALPGCSPDGLSLLVEQGQPPRPGLLQLTAPCQTRTPPPPSGPVVPPQAAPSQTLMTAQSHPDRPDMTFRPETPGPRTPALAQTLPSELLDLILRYLPVSSYSQCALVCRRWYSLLPAIHMRLAHWLRQHAIASANTGQLFPAGINRRITPWLARHRCQLWAVLQRQHKELCRLRQLTHAGLLRSEKAQQQENRAGQLLAGLTGYCIHHQITQARQMTLRCLAMQWHDRGQLVSFTFSANCHWLATALCSPGSERKFLYVHGWKNGSWHEESMVPPPSRPVSTFGFSHTMSDILFSAHDNYLLAWQRQTDAQVWRCIHRYSIDEAHRVCAFAPMACGDLIILTEDPQHRERQQMILFCQRDKGLGWGQQMSCLQLEGLRFTVFQQKGSWLAQILSRPDLQAGHYRNEVRVWKKGLYRSRPDDWDCRMSLLQIHRSPVEQAAGFPGNHYHVTILFEDGSIFLWTLDQEYRLHNQLMLHASLPPALQTRNMGNLMGLGCHGKQLALAQSLHQIQFWELHDNGEWQRGSTLEMATSASSDPDERLKRVQLSGDGQTLICTTSRQVDVWQKDAGGLWHWRVHRRTTAGAPAPQGLLAGPGSALCLTAEGEEGIVWIHAPDRQGRLIRKGCVTLSAPLAGPFYASADGLTLLFNCRGYTPGWQVEFPDPPQ